MIERRATYFTFQGLLMSVLLLLFLYESRGAEGWLPKILSLSAFLSASLIAVRLVSIKRLSDWRFQTALFIGDAGLASLTLYWTQPQSTLYLLYFIIIFGTTLTRSYTQSFFVALISSALYLLTSWIPTRGFSNDPIFWLRFVFLWVAAAMLAILSGDIRDAQKDEEKKFQSRLMHLESLATLGQMAAEVAHRIKGPLTTIMVNAEVLGQRFPKSGDAQRELLQIQDEVNHCKEILKSLLMLGRIEETDLSVIDLRDPIRSAAESVEPQIKRKRLSLYVGAMPQSMKIHGDRSLLHEAFFAILQNAVDAAKERGSIRIDAGQATELWWTNHPKNSFQVIIEDDGKGIATADLPKLFQPFFTTKGKEGSGIGLSAALRIMQKHDGFIEAFSDGPGLGAKFTLSIPKAPGAPFKEKTARRAGISRAQG